MESKRPIDTEPFVRALHGWLTSMDLDRAAEADVLTTDVFLEAAALIQDPRFVKALNAQLNLPKGMTPADAMYATVSFLSAISSVNLPDEKLPE